MDVRVWDGGPLVVGYHVRFGQEVISGITGVIRYGQLTLYLNRLFFSNEGNGVGPSRSDGDGGVDSTSPPRMPQVRPPLHKMVLFLWTQC